MAPKLTRLTRAVKKLRGMFEDGRLNGNEHPKSVWESDTLFREHKLANFWTCFNNLKREFLSRTGSNLKNLDVNGDDPEDTEGLNRLCTVPDAMAKINERHNTHQVEFSEDESLEVLGSKELLGNGLHFSPLHLISEWKEAGTTTRRLMVAILLPSSVEGSFKLLVENGGRYLRLEVTWPKALVDVCTLHKLWLEAKDSSLQEYHPKVQGFEVALKKFSLRKTDPIESVARICLPFTVQTDIYESHNLAWNDNTAMVVYVELKAFVEDYSLIQDHGKFKVA